MQLLCLAWHASKEPHLQQILKVHPPKCVKPVLKSILLNIGSYFFNILVPGLSGWLRVTQGGESRLEPGVCFWMTDSAAVESSAPLPRIWGVCATPSWCLWQSSFLRAFLCHFALGIVSSMLPPALKQQGGQWIRIPVHPVCFLVQYCCWHLQ